jgi:hypothetical protein
MKIQTERKNREELIETIEDLSEICEMEEEHTKLLKERIEIDKDIFVNKRISIIIHLRQIEKILMNNSFV